MQIDDHASKHKRAASSRPLRIGAPPPSVLPFEVATLDEILNRVAPIDLLAALQGRRGATLHVRGDAS